MDVVTKRHYFIVGVGNSDIVAQYRTEFILADTTSTHGDNVA
jgi:hypothetical protein